ncbi:MAG: response regulator [Gemmatimonadaceae bacterium]|nr:response regulator [Gemmatimonadaceae bacterium]
MNGRVLLVEDSPMISGALRMLLEAGGFEVTLATTAAEAMAWSGPERADVMLLDIGLPDADGLSVIGALDARGLRPVTTYAMTGHGDAATRERCLAAGCDDVLLKPVPVQQLLRIVSEAVA